MSNFENTRSLSSMNLSANKKDNDIISKEDAISEEKTVGSGDTLNSTQSIVNALVKVFPAGLAEEVVVKKLMSTYHIDKDTAKTCYDAAIEQVAKKNNVSKTAIQKNPGLVNGENKKKQKDGMSNLNDWGKYQKQLLENSNSGAPQGGD